MGKSAHPYRFLGKAFHRDSKLFDLCDRHYAPTSGHLRSKDPVASLATLPQPLNPYAYNSPLAYPDPSSRCPICVAALPILEEITLATAEDAAINAGPETDTFGVRTADGTPRTMYVPDPTVHGYPTNLDYFNAQ